MQPTVEHATAQAVIKGEDVILVCPDLRGPKGEAARLHAAGLDKSLSDSASSVHARGGGLAAGELQKEGVISRQGSLDGGEPFGLYCVFDGHNGASAAQHLEEVLVSSLQERLPPGPAPPESDALAHTLWREGLQRAAVELFCDVNAAFACKGEVAGSTITVVLQCGWLLTVANCGDSRALLDTGAEVLQLSVDHRISTHQADRRRLQALGAQIAPIDASGNGPALTSIGYGPLRVWPGGLCLSRGVGDFDVGPPVICCPHLFQVRVPDSGGRLFIATDGVWDGFENMRRLARMCRPWACQVAPGRVISAIRAAFGGLRDDTSIIVLDLTPPGLSFPQAVAALPKRRRGPGAGACFCFAPRTAEGEEAGGGEAQPQRVAVHLNMDTAAVCGLMPAETRAEGPPLQPSWATAEFCQAVASSQEAACSAWAEARSMRSVGKVPSRQDLAGYFAAAQLLRPSLPLHGLELSTRLPSGGALSRAQLEDITVKPRGPSLDLGGLAARAAAAGAAPGAGRQQGDASVRFSEHVADPKSFARMFGHYKSQMAAEAGGGDGGSTTEEDSSCHAGGRLEPAAGSAGAKPPPRAPPRMQAVPEELRLSRRRSLEEVLQEPAAAARGEAAAEMAVRRGKNRFTDGGAAAAGKPPLPEGVRS